MKAISGQSPILYPIHYRITDTWSRWTVRVPAMTVSGLRTSGGFKHFIRADEKLSEVMSDEESTKEISGDEEYIYDEDDEEEYEEEEEDDDYEEAKVTLGNIMCLCP